MDQYIPGHYSKPPSLDNVFIFEYVHVYLYRPAEWAQSDLWPAENSHQALTAERVQAGGHDWHLHGIEADRAPRKKKHGQTRCGLKVLCSY